MKSEREQLIELIRKGIDERSVSSVHEPFDRYFADYLLANGVIVPPVKVGDEVYSCIGRNYYVRRITIKDGIRLPTTFLLESGLYGQLCVTESDFGSLVFLTREEAERELERR